MAPVSTPVRPWVRNGSLRRVVNPIDDPESPAEDSGSHPPGALIDLLRSGERSVAVTFAGQGAVWWGDYERLADERPDLAEYVAAIEAAIGEVAERPDASMGAGRKRRSGSPHRGS